MIGKSVMLGLAVAGYAAASEMPTFQQPATTYTTYQQPIPANERTGFGANANVGYGNGNGLGFGADINTPFLNVGGNGEIRTPTFANNNLLMGLIVFLGVLSFINIALTVVTPWLSGLGGDDDADDAAEKNVEKGRRYQRNINMMADYVLNGIESFAKKNE